MILKITQAVLLWLAISASASAQDSHREILAAKFQRALETAASEAPGSVGISIIDVDGGRSFGVNEELVFPQGSAIKVTIAASLYIRQARGELDVDDTVSIVAGDRVGGSGYLRHFGDGTTSMSLHDLSVMMITVSDNMATNILIDRVGMQNVNDIMTELGFDDIKLQRKMIRAKQSALGNENIASPSQAAQLMARILTCDLPIDEADCVELQDILAIPHPGPIEEGTPSGVRVLQKTGTIRGVRTSWGAVELEGRPYALAVMGTFTTPDRISLLIREVAEDSHEYFSRLAGATAYGTRVPVELMNKVRGQQP